jgi:hypothetical protein
VNSITLRITVKIPENGEVAVMWWNDKDDEHEPAPPRGVVEHMIQREAQDHLARFFKRITDLYQFHMKVQTMVKGDKT